MIRDLEIMKNITPLFEKKLIVWGVGQIGRRILDDLVHMGAGKNGILLCDSNISLWGEKIGNYIILSPQELGEALNNSDISDISVLVTVASLKAQDEIINCVEELYGEAINIYTLYAIVWGIYLDIKNFHVLETFKNQKLIERERNSKNIETLIWEREKYLKYFAFLPLHNNEIILVYQPGKVASSALYRSIQKYNKNVLHCHDLNDIEENEGDLYHLSNMHSAKIICLVRDPIARQIAVMWQNIQEMYRYSSEVNFSEIETYYFSENFDGREFQWFDNQMKRFFRIDVFEHPFDRDKGYGIIEKENISLLLIKMEKVNELENVIGDFLNIKEFHLCKENVGEEKPYRFAFKEYKKNFCLPKEQLNRIYNNDENMKHFYTARERNDFYMKWSGNVDV